MPAAPTSRAYRIVAWEKAPALVAVPEPTPGPGQVVVRVAGCGLCHSDVAMMAMPAGIGEALGWQLPFTLGHESAGWVHAIGPGVEGHQVGEAVAGEAQDRHQAVSIQTAFTLRNSSTCCKPDSRP